MREARQAVGLVVLALGLMSPASAAAQSGDPAEGSPSGVIYEIPLDHARQDAAPTSRSGGSGGGSGSAGGSGGVQGSAGAGAQGGAASPIRSENGFGSSSTVPGAASAPAPKAKSGGKGSKSGSGSGSGSGAAGARTPAGSSGGTSAAVAERLGPPRSASLTPSKSRAYLLLLLALLVAAGLGLAGRYVARRR